MAIAVGAWMVLATDRAEPARFGRRELATAFREGSLRLVLIALELLPSEAAPVATPRRVPVLLVPEIGRGRGSLWFLQTFLLHRGAIAWSVGNTSGDLGLAERAEELSRRVDELARSTGSTRVDVVAHGSGGLVAAWAARHLDATRRIRRLVTLGTPWSGTRTAVFARGRVGPEMLFGNPLLAALAPPPVPTVAIASDDDASVVPSTSAVPDGAASVRIGGVGHLDMVGSAVVFRAVQAALDAPEAGSAA